MEKELKEQLTSLNFKENRFGGLDGSYKGYQFTVTESPFNTVIIYSYISQRTIMEPQEKFLPKNADLQMIIESLERIVGEKWITSIEVENLNDRKFKKYPEIYIRENNQWVFTDVIQDFDSAITHLDYALGSYEHSQVLNELELFMGILLKIYEKGLKLPVIEFDKEIERPVESGEYTDMFRDEQIINCFMKYHVDLKEISDSINNLLEDLLNYGYYYEPMENDTPDEVAGCVYSWKKTFGGEGGWGEKTLNLLLIIHKAINQIKEPTR